MKRFKDWLIRRLGGYTLEDMMDSRRAVRGPKVEESWRVIPLTFQAVCPEREEEAPGWEGLGRMAAEVFAEREVERRLIVSLYGRGIVRIEHRKVGGKRECVGTLQVIPAYPMARDGGWNR